MRTQMHVQQGNLLTARSRRNSVKSSVQKGLSGGALDDEQEKTGEDETELIGPEDILMTDEEARVTQLVNNPREVEEPLFFLTPSRKVEEPSFFETPAPGPYEGRRRNSFIDMGPSCGGLVH